MLLAFGRHYLKYRHLHIKRNLCRKPRCVDRSGDSCPSLFTFRGHYENLPLDTIESRSSTHPRLWLRRCRRSGQSIRAFGIASQRSKGKCGSTSIFSSGTKTSGIPVDSRVPYRTDATFPSSPPLAVAEINSRHEQASSASCPPIRDSGWMTGKPGVIHGRKGRPGMSASHNCCNQAFSSKPPGQGQ
jgi:hypothetical protein